MAAVAPAASGEPLSERVAGGSLPEVLNPFDTVAIFVAIVLFTTNAAVIQSTGPTAFGIALISYGTWFWWAGGIVLASMAVGALLHLLGRRTAASAAPTGAVPAAGSSG